MLSELVGPSANQVPSTLGSLLEQVEEHFVLSAKNGKLHVTTDDRRSKGIDILGRLEPRTRINALTLSEPGNMPLHSYVLKGMEVDELGYGGVALLVAQEYFTGKVTAVVLECAAHEWATRHYPEWMNKLGSAVAEAVGATPNLGSAGRRLPLGEQGKELVNLLNKTFSEPKESAGETSLAQVRFEGPRGR